MPRQSAHDAYLRKYILFMLFRDYVLDSDSDSDSSESDSSDDENFDLDLTILETIRQTRYLGGRSRRQEKAGSLHLAWKYSEHPDDHMRFMKMLRVSPIVFDFVLACIKDHPVFTNQSNVPQTPVDVQLAVTLYRMGRYGNAASVSDIARNCGLSVGSVEHFTDRCFTAIEALHDQFVKPLSSNEKEVEKEWIDGHLGISGSLWREGYLMYDGTIVVLSSRPGWNGDAYFTRKGNYGLNLQIGNVPSNLRIVDYSHGFTGSAHDAAAFEYTGASLHPDVLFQGQEFAWADSAYPISEHVIPVHRQPASFKPENKFFDRVVAGLRVRSEHCMGALKGRFQCLRGLRVNINSAEDHKRACRWITIAIILHNLVIDAEGKAGGIQFLPNLDEGVQNGGEGVGAGNIPAGVNIQDEAEVGENKRNQLIVEILVAYGQEFGNEGGNE
ncbi:hypothetical protein EST38_g11040 [Candolleomyces aberdarensis]|uniref:DDE Tnp4 domain-containing protein n=1 Tax=Candolleomyces aberdarensis TaxID=2316362 RepID=A0A4V1Q2E6_9AGAR|nr:hypothetical protein EST38_g11040 [Candolleomyces aberdarensis]